VPTGAPGDVWHLEEILQSKRDKRAAKRLLLRLIKYHALPKWIITDKLRSYGAAKREVAPGLDQWSSMGLNNRAEKSPVISKAGTSDAKLPVTRRITAVRFNSFRHPKLFCHSSQTPRRPDYPISPNGSFRSLGNLSLSQEFRRKPLRQV